MVEDSGGLDYKEVISKLVDKFKKSIERRENLIRDAGEAVGDLMASELSEELKGLKEWPQIRERHVFVQLIALKAFLLHVLFVDEQDIRELKEVLEELEKRPKKK